MILTGLIVVHGVEAGLIFSNGYSDVAILFVKELFY
jgi:hypothetical protein